MRPRLDQSRSAHRDQMDAATPLREDMRGERVREIRRRIEDDAYRSPEVADAIARRILLSREL